MPIRAHLAEGAVYEPEAIQAMSTAFELACADLQVFAGDQRGREIIAARIIALARNGSFDASTLHQRVIAEAHLSL
jgi:hypothetical protein